MNTITPAFFALLFVSAIPGVAQTKVLVAKSRVPISVVGDYSPGNIALPTACDEQGRFYVKLIKPGTAMAGSLFRWSSKGTMEAEFDTTGAFINRYAVRPGGGVIMIHSDGYSKLLDNFGPDGTRDSSVALESPPLPFFPSQLAVFPSGEVLMSGMQFHPGYKAATAVYDSTGHVVKQVTLDGDVETERAIDKDTSGQQQNKSAINQSVAITGDDGLVYLMRATSPPTVYAISAAGDVVRKIVVRSPAGGGVSDFGIRVVKNRLAVQFRRNCESDSCRTSAYSVVDATTGKTLAAYVADEEVSGAMVCYAPDPDRFFIFSYHDGPEIVEAQPK